MKLRNQKAFTLIEVVLAMMIMASGLFILTNSWAGTYNRLNKTQTQVQLAALLERKIVELEREFKGQPLDSIKEEDTGDFGSELEGYTWEMKSQKVEFPDLSGIIGGVGENQNLDLVSIMKLFSEHLSKSVKEVKVTVIYKDKKKPITVDVVFYIVDYDRPLPMPGGAGGS
ncbi:MAG: prepilin-type N-terminal cleavage/methylation domain-containing protein [Pseudobdellovibrio sp.]|nr:prepilin-type N-terminal cleavage/methylation domain-containing protein [Pseudobdellovibrio sp.]